MNFTHLGLESQEVEQHNETHHEDHAHSSDFVKDTVVASASVAGALFIIAGNLGTLVSFGRCRRLQTIPNMYVCSLAIADLLVGLVLFMKGSLGFPSARAVFENKYFCLCVVSAMFTSVAASIFSSSLVAFDRYMFIQYPLRYHDLITREVSLACIIASWCIAVIYGFLPIRWSEFDYNEDCAPTHIFPFQYMIIIHPLVFFSLSALIFTLYAKIFRIALGHQNRIHVQKSMVQPTINTCSIGDQSNFIISSSEITQQSCDNHLALRRPGQQPQAVMITVQECQMTPRPSMKSSGPSNHNFQSPNRKLQRHTLDGSGPLENPHLQGEYGESVEQQGPQQDENRDPRQFIPSQNGQAEAPQKTPRVSRSSWKMIKAMVLTFGLFFLCWCPLLVVAYIEYTVHVSHLALSIAGMVGLLNSGKNCLVLVSMNKDFRRQFKLLFCCNCKPSRGGRVFPCDHRNDDFQGQPMN